MVQRVHNAAPNYARNAETTSSWNDASWLGPLLRPKPVRHLGCNDSNRSCSENFRDTADSTEKFCTFWTRRSGFSFQREVDRLGLHTWSENKDALEGVEKLAQDTRGGQRWRDLWRTLIAAPRMPITT